MSERLQDVRKRLDEAGKERGRLALVATGSGVPYRTIYNIMRDKSTPNATTVDKLAAYFKKEERKARQ